MQRGHHKICGGLFIFYDVYAVVALRWAIFSNFEENRLIF